MNILRVIAQVFRDDLFKGNGNIFCHGYSSKIVLNIQNIQNDDNSKYVNNLKYLIGYYPQILWKTAGKQGF